MGESLQSSNQLLSLKVIRLSRPKRSEGSPLQVDPVDPSRFSQLINAALASGEKRYDTPIGEYLIAPLMFENIYLGETFTFYMNVVNESDQKVTDVSVKCELQTNSQRVNLTSSVQDVILEPSQSSGQIITHEVKEIGQHILICSVNYKTSSDEKMYFRKFFKFPVGKPIDVKTKFYNAESVSTCVAVAQVVSIMAIGVWRRIDGSGARPKIEGVRRYIWNGRSCRALRLASWTN
ncbi:hypothetical protein Y032_0068g254 [Ancylostoma ceylanicum]|uniref:Trafficking protein particle complex subunit 13 N-terminal domain-containing protein n=1 Tax=Ancylostoma ceylanicum TaxID=53326 RepID=A0A016TZ10_9BILA|nr:hypothetical protein Y032_0068g254 [Ancylostoma ceylanicum]